MKEEMRGETTEKIVVDNVEEAEIEETDMTEMMP